MEEDRGSEQPRRSWGTTRPRWWPEGEPYPPTRGQWPRVRGRFVRRFAAMFVGAFVFFGFVVAAFITILVNIFSSATSGGGMAAFIPLAIVVFLLFATAARGFRRFAAPLGELIEAAESVEAGNYGVRVSVRAHGPRELRSLATAFNSMSGRLESSERERRRLLADVTHELRTPLTIMQGNLEALLDGVYPADAEHMQPILDETRVLSRLVDDLRTLSLAEAGALTLHREPTDVGQLLTDCVASFRVQADAAGIELATALDGVLPQAEVDPVRMREVLSNLLSNAMRYTPRGGTVRVGASVVDGKVRVSVRDSGPGIAAEALPHIFDRFFKSDESRGAGLGLAIAKSLVVAHGGEIDATSEVGHGTDMRFTLPIAS